MGKRESFGGKGEGGRNEDKFKGGGKKWEGERGEKARKKKIRKESRERMKDKDEVCLWTHYCFEIVFVGTFVYNNPAFL